MSQEIAKEHSAFLNSTRRHILMITNHGVHQWNVVPGLPDTGGQNVFVNQFSEVLAKLGFKVTIVNRGGYPHPTTGEQLEGLHYRDDHQRILYLQDDLPTFVRKEDMHAQIPGLVKFLQDFIKSEGTTINLIISHYWDAAVIGAALNNSLPTRLKHIWVPHSLGTLKKRNVSPDNWEHLRINERIQAEKAVIKDLDGVAATSSIIRQALADDYGYKTPEIFLPPCVDAERYYPQQITDYDPIWDFLSQNSGLSAAEIRGCKIITEISRTDTTKRKDVLIKAFAKAQSNFPDSFLAVTIDDKLKELAGELRALIKARNLETHVAVLGSIWDILPTLYAITDIYCTPSVMEGFGMSPQEAAATHVPTVASNLVPYVTEYLLGPEPVEIRLTDNPEHAILKGDGAIVVQADDVDGFAFALEMLLDDDDLRIQMGKNAYKATIPYFTWDHMVRVFLDDIGFEQG
jgi:glycosyltransferase involved in cell wall biosynthesis